MNIFRHLGKAIGGLLWKSDEKSKHSRPLGDAGRGARRKRRKQRSNRKQLRYMQRVRRERGQNRRTGG